MNVNCLILTFVMAILVQKDLIEKMEKKFNEKGNFFQKSRKKAVLL